MIKAILSIAVLLIGAILVFAATRPDSFGVQRATSIKAPPEKIFPFINEFDRWSAWSPYEKRDPAMKRTRSGSGSGKGAVYAWEGNSEVGAGRMEILDTAPPSRVLIDLQFVKPFETTNKVEFTLQPKGDATDVTWAMQGPMPYISKVITLFVDMDKMIGKDFEAGLANLKAVTEK
jgi:hypothetical protein